MTKTFRSAKSMSSKWELIGLQVGYDGLDSEKVAAVHVNMGLVCMALELYCIAGHDDIFRVEREALGASLQERNAVTSTSPSESQSNTSYESPSSSSLGTGHDLVTVAEMLASAVSPVSLFPAPVLRRSWMKSCCDGGNGGGGVIKDRCLAPGKVGPPVVFSPYWLYRTRQPFAEIQDPAVSWRVAASQLPGRD